MNKDISSNILPDNSTVCQCVSVNRYGLFRTTLNHQNPKII